MDKIDEPTLNNPCLRKRHQNLKAANSLSSYKIREINYSEGKLELDYSSPDSRGWIRTFIQTKGEKIQIEAYSLLSITNPHREEILLLRDTIPKTGYNQGFSPTLPERIGRRLQTSQLLQKVKELDRDVARYRREKHEELRFISGGDF